MNNARTPLFLMANLGAEVSRVYSLFERNDRVNAISASERAYKIISEIMLFPEMIPRAEEIEKVADILDSKVHHGTINVSAADINDYFNVFALRAIGQ
ncbi:MAG: hypothetical protein V4438_03320 [Patescibacteria group bacterium]